MVEMIIKKVESHSEYKPYYGLKIACSILLIVLGALIVCRIRIDDLNKYYMPRIQVFFGFLIICIGSAIGSYYIINKFSNWINTPPKL